MYHPSERNPNGVYLKWNPASFLPLPSDLAGEENWVSEWTNPDFHWTEEHTGEYVSLAAMLTSTRFALHCMNIANIGSHATFDADVLQLEIDLNLISEELARYNSFCNTLYVYAQYWEQYQKIIMYAADHPVTDKGVRDLTKAASDFIKDIKPLSFRGKDKKLEAYHLLVSMAKRVSEEVCSEEDITNARTFALNAKQFFRNSLINNKKLNALVKLIQTVLNDNADNAFNPAIPVTPDECDHLLKQLQLVANHIGNTVNEVAGNSPTWLEDMRDKTNTIKTWLYPSGKNMGNDFLYRYTEKGRGCVAILKIRNQHRDECFLTFSGFADCEDPLLIKELDIQLPFYCQAPNFSRICKMLSDAYHHDFTYVSYTHTIAEHIKRYEVELFDRSRTPRCYKPHYPPKTISEESPEITLKEEIEDRKFLFPGLNNEEKIANYACCERKILAYLEGNGIHPETSEAVWFIKYYPCIQCARAIDLWRTEQKLTKLTFLYPLLDRK